MKVFTVLRPSHCTQLSSFPGHVAQLKSCQNSRMMAWNSATQTFGSCRRTHRNRWLDMKESLAFDFCFINSANWAKQQKLVSIWITLSKLGVLQSCTASHGSIALPNDASFHPDQIKVINADVAAILACKNMNQGSIFFLHLSLFGIIECWIHALATYPSTVLSFLDEKTVKSRWVMSNVANNMGLSTLFSLFFYSLILYTQSFGTIINWLLEGAYTILLLDCPLTSDGVLPGQGTVTQPMWYCWFRRQDIEIWVLMLWFTVICSCSL